MRTPPLVLAAALVCLICASTAYAVTFTGTDREDSLFGSPRADVIDAKGAADIVFGLSGVDNIQGGAGRDDVTGGSGADPIFAGSGNDVVHARDRARDTIDCAAGRDTVVADRADRVARNCERVRRG